MNYTLEGKNPIPCDDILVWAKWFEKADRIVKRTEIGKILISTVFLGIDHNFLAGPPILFETMTFGDVKEYQERYSTWEEAEKGHDRMVEKVKSNDKNS